MSWTTEENDIVQALNGGSITKAEREILVNRLHKLRVPQVDGVDRGAIRQNFLIRKSELNPEETNMAKLNDADTKIDKGEAKAATLDILKGAGAQLAELIETVNKAEGDGDQAAVLKATEAIAKVLSAMPGAEPAKKAVGDKKPNPFAPKTPEEEALAAEEAKAKKEKAEKSKVAKRDDEGSLDLGEGVILKGALAEMAEGMIQKAGKRMGGDRMARFRKAMASLVKVWKEMDPNNMSDQMKALLGDVDGIAKRADGQDEQLADIAKSLKILITKKEADGGAPAPAAVADGNAQAGDEVKPIVKSAPAPKVTPPGVDMGGPATNFFAAEDK